MYIGLQIGIKGNILFDLQSKEFFLSSDIIIFNPFFLTNILNTYHLILIPRLIIIHIHMIYLISLSFMILPVMSQQILTLIFLIIITHQIMIYLMFIQRIPHQLQTLHLLPTLTMITRIFTSQHSITYITWWFISTYEIFSSDSPSYIKWTSNFFFK